MTDQNDRQNRSGETTSGSLGGQATDTDSMDAERDQGETGRGSSMGGGSSMGDRTSSRGGGGSSSGGGVSTGGMSDPVVGGQDTETQPGSWGNRSGSGSGGEGERELVEESTAGGDVSEDITGTPGTNG